MILLLAVACADDAPAYDHDEPDEANNQTCVVCHACGTDGTSTDVAPTPGKSHTVCDDCHASDPPEHNCDLSCDWQKDCDTDPPYANCDQCHAAGVPQKTIAQVNDACRRCHVKED